MDSGHVSLDPRLQGGVETATPPEAVPNPDYSPVMVRRRYYQDRIMLDRDAHFGSYHLRCGKQNTAFPTPYRPWTIGKI